MLIREIVSYAKSFIGTPYKWGGDNPIEGFDCSGFVLETLRAFGLFSSADCTAQGIYDTLMERNGSSSLMMGAILFFGADEKSINHVAICLNDKFMLEAGGGDSSTITREDAAKKNAFVRVRPIRANLIAAIMPY